MRQSEDKRRYDDACAAAHGMDLIGDRWAMPVIRELLLGPRRFTDLKASLRGISANVLTQRLAGLEEAGILIRRKLPPPASVQVYELTPWGYEAAPIFQAIGRWAVRSPRHDPTRPFSPVSLMLSLRTMFSPEAAGDYSARVQLWLDGEPFFWIRDGGDIRIGRGEIEAPDFSFAGSPTDIAGAVYGGAPLETAGAKGDLAKAARFLTFFPMPPKAPAAA
ncbi:MAG TPA: helix-turn-helix domain-containing protein [Sphingomicrobium sp.]|nr:helix-turn-helix domain-containing protein [Sphingomicrobium sp.]